MRTLVFGAGPLGCLYTHLLSQAGKDVTLLARGHRYEWIKANGLMLVNELTGVSETSSPPVVSELRPEDDYDLVIVLIRKNKLPPVFKILAANTNIKNALFMGNNALGFEQYLQHSPQEKLLFGFPGAGGGVSDNVVHYADREKPRGKRRGITIGEIDGDARERTRAVKALFETSGVPVNLTRDIDGWLKYHVALASPLVNAFYKYNCDNYALARDKETLRVLAQERRPPGCAGEAARV